MPFWSRDCSESGSYHHRCMLALSMHHLPLEGGRGAREGVSEREEGEGRKEGVRDRGTEEKQ